MTGQDIEKYKKAGKIAKQVKKYARKIIEKDKLLIEIAEEIEGKIIELDGKIAFPTNLAIDDIAAHYTPSHNDKNKAKGLLKIDIGIHVDGYIADTAFTIDLKGSEENKKLIKASDKALKKAIENTDQEVREIGKSIQKTMDRYDFSPITNLQGHKLGRYDLHAGINVPNYDNGNEEKLSKGYYAIEPFSTTGQGKVYEGKPSGIYKLVEKKPVRLHRDILKFISSYHNLPFCSRWLVKKFGKKALLALKSFEEKGIVKQYPQLVEEGHGKVSQSEHTVYFDGKAKVLT